jgi:riboflavin biosynthesis pyrimidine reductase
MKSYESVQSELKSDGSLRDIYIYQANSDVWNNFISLVLGSEQNHEFWHGENKISMPTNFEEIKALQNTDPTILKIFIEGGVQLNCHFFTEEEIEMDVTPNEIGEKSKFNSLVAFLRWLSKELKTNIHFTHENSLKEEIMVIEYENV